MIARLHIEMLKYVTQDDPSSLLLLLLLLLLLYIDAATYLYLFFPIFYLYLSLFTLSCIVAAKLLVRNQAK